MAFSGLMDSECHSCGNRVLYHNIQQADVVCTKCGAIQKARIVDEGAEWRSYTEDDSNLEAIRASGGDDQLGINTIEVISNNPRIQTLLEETARRIEGPADSRILANHYYVKEFGTLMQLPKSIQDQALQFFALCIREKGDVSRDKQALAAACLYISCRVLGFPRTLEEFCRVTSVRKEVLVKVQQSLCEYFKFKLPMIHPEDLVPRYLYFCKLDSILAENCEQMCREIRTRGLLEGTSPQLITVMVILIIAVFSDIHGDFNDLLTVGSCSLPAIQRAYLFLRPHVALILQSINFSPSKKSNISRQSFPDKIEDLINRFKSSERSQDIMKKGSLTSTSSYLEMIDSCSPSNVTTSASGVTGTTGSCYETRSSSPQLIERNKRAYSIIAPRNAGEFQRLLAEAEYVRKTRRCVGQKLNTHGQSQNLVMPPNSSSNNSSNSSDNGGIRDGLSNKEAKREETIRSDNSPGGDSCRDSHGS